MWLEDNSYNMLHIKIVYKQKHLIVAMVAQSARQHVMWRNILSQFFLISSSYSIRALFPPSRALLCNKESIIGRWRHREWCNSIYLEVIVPGLRGIFLSTLKSCWNLYRHKGESYDMKFHLLQHSEQLKISFGLRYLRILTKTFSGISSQPQGSSYASTVSLSLFLFLSMTFKISVKSSYSMLLQVNLIEFLLIGQL